MIVSSGYNIAGPEVEAALLAHDAVAECAVVGAPTIPIAARSSRRMWCWPKASPPSAEMCKALQDHVKAAIAPYKYPRSVRFHEALPKTPTGKIQRFILRDQAR